MFLCNTHGMNISGDGRDGDKYTSPCSSLFRMSEESLYRSEITSESWTCLEANKATRRSITVYLITKCNCNRFQLDTQRQNCYWCYIPIWHTIIPFLSHVYIGDVTCTAGRGPAWSPLEKYCSLLHWMQNCLSTLFSNFCKNNFNIFTKIFCARKQKSVRDSSSANKLTYLLTWDMRMRQTAICLLYTSPSPRD